MKLKSLNRLISWRSFQLLHFKSMSQEKKERRTVYLNYGISSSNFKREAINACVNLARRYDNMLELLHR